MALCALLGKLQHRRWALLSMTATIRWRPTYLLYPTSTYLILFGEYLDLPENGWPLLLLPTALTSKLKLDNTLFV